MSNITPLKAVYDTNDETVKSLAEFTVNDVVGVSDGGTGVSTLGNIVSGDSSVTITGGQGAVVGNVVVKVNTTAISFAAPNLSGILDGGTFT